MNIYIFLFVSTLMFKVDMQSGIPSKQATLQVMLYPERYQSEAHWAIYGNGAVRDEDKLIAMAKRLQALGATRLTEKSFGTAAACALYRSCSSVDTALNNTRQLKFIFGQNKAVRLKGPAVYPEAPETLEDTHVDLWQQIQTDGPIVPSKVDAFEMSIIKARVTCRSTKAGCSTPASGGHPQRYNEPLREMRTPRAEFMRPIGRQTTFLEDGSECTVYGEGYPHNPHPPRAGPPNLGMPNVHGFATPLGMPQYQPALQAIMDQAASEGTQASAGGVPAAPPALGAAPVLGLVEAFHKKAKATPAAVSKKVAVKSAKALQVQSHGILFCHTTLNHI